jgi:polyhydroxybutyrate depolymerase
MVCGMMMPAMHQASLNRPAAWRRSIVADPEWHTRHRYRRYLHVMAIKGTCVRDRGRNIVPNHGHRYRSTAEFRLLKFIHEDTRGDMPGKRQLRSIWLVIVAALALASYSGTADATEIRELVVNGVKRSYRLFLPSDLSSAPVPLVIALHGAVQSAKEFESDLGMNRIATREKFAVAYPIGLNRVWDDSRPAALRLGFLVQPGDDVAFLTALTRMLVNEGIADPGRVYMTGLSMGGFMTERMACEQAELFAAIAVIAATVPKKYRQTCKPGRAMPALIMHGTADPISSWYGIVLPGAELLSVNESAQFYADLAGCMASSETALPDTGPARASTVTVRRWSTCRGSAAVMLYRIQGGGHLPPSFDPGRGETLVAMLLGERSHAIDAAEEIWKFFRQFRQESAAQRGISAQ